MTARRIRFSRYTELVPSLSITLSILVPVYNEVRSVRSLLERVRRETENYFRSAGIAAELIVVDDGSRDGSANEIEKFAGEHSGFSLRLIRHERNRGKGAAIRTALTEARGDYSLIQDADMEYNPAEYPRLLTPLLAGEADFVLGSRFADASRQVSDAPHALANRLISKLTSWASGLAISDAETCYKAFRTSLVQSIPLRSERFGLDPELVIKAAQRHARIFEVPISYRARTAAQGKKIRASDGVAAVAVILRTAFSLDIYRDQGTAMLGEMARGTRFNQWMAEVLLPYVAGDVLELGAGIGNLSILLCRAGRSYTATDTDREHLLELLARFENCETVRTVVCDASDSEAMAQFRANYDTVVCLNVLEHIEDDRAALRHIYGCLRPDGRAVVLVPQGPRAFGSLDGVLEHKRRYARAELAEKMREAGFQLDALLSFNRATYPGWWLNSKILRRRTLSTTQLRVFDWLVPMWKRIDGRLPWGPTSLIAVGRRAL